MSIVPVQRVPTGCNVTRSLHIIDSGDVFSTATVRFSVVIEDIIVLKLFCVYVDVFRSNNNLLYYLRLTLANMLTPTTQD